MTETNNHIVMLGTGNALATRCYNTCFTLNGQDGSQMLPDGQRLCCLGDEPFNESCRSYAEGADWLMSEAFLRKKRRQPSAGRSLCLTTWM